MKAFIFRVFCDDYNTAHVIRKTIELIGNGDSVCVTTFDGRKYEVVQQQNLPVKVRSEVPFVNIMAGATFDLVKSRTCGEGYLHRGSETLLPIDFVMQNLETGGFTGFF